MTSVCCRQRIGVTRPSERRATTVTAASTFIAERLAAERLLAEAVVATGTLKRAADADGSAYVSPDEGEGDLLVHSVGLGVGRLAAGARVEFEVHTGPTGLEAYDVLPIAGAPAPFEYH
jgi:cold shock CspA family protein